MSISFKLHILSRVFNNPDARHPEWRMRVLPGPTPQMVTLADAAALDPNQWVVTAKDDGIRALVVVTADGVVAFNRSFEPIYEANPPPGTTLPHSITILDTEMMPGARFVVHDCIVAEDNYVGNAKYTLRMRVAAKACSVVSARCLPLMPDFPLTLAVKEHALLANAGDILLRGRDASDGIVLTRNEGVFMPNAHIVDVYKWKLSQNCTVDFMVDPAAGTMALQENDAPIFADRLTQEAAAAGNVTAPCLCECVLTDRGWRVVRKREDRNRPNSVSVAMQSLSHMVSSSTIFAELMKKAGIK